MLKKTPQMCAKSKNVMFASVVMEQPTTNVPPKKAKLHIYQFLHRYQ